MFTIKCQRHNESESGVIWDVFETPRYRLRYHLNSVSVEFGGQEDFNGLWVYRQEGVKVYPVNVYRQIIVENAAGKTTEHYRSWLMQEIPRDQEDVAA